MRLIFFATLLLFLGSTNQSISSEAGNPVSVKSTTINAFAPSNPNQNVFSQLTFLGGLVLTSDDKDFGGISGIRMLDDNRFFAITDKGKWLEAQIIREKNKPVSIANAKMGRLHDVAGKKMRGSKRADAEGLEISGSDYLISFERNHRGEVFNFNKGKLRAKSKKLLFELNDVELGNNKGPEGIALAPDTSPLAGSILAFPEISYNGKNNLRVFIFKDGKREELTIKPSAGFSLTDAAFLPNGDLFLLERRFSLLTGMGMRLRLFEASSVKANAILEGDVLIAASESYEIDNMEGLALFRLPDGSIRLTLISDDNFSKYQRTLLLEFSLKPSFRQ